MMPGVFKAVKKNGDVYFRSSCTYKNKHISLGSFETELKANTAYKSALKLINNTKRIEPENYSSSDYPEIPFKKWISILNFKNNGLYCKTPIYMQHNFFRYYLSPTDVLYFDVDDLFYYSNHSIMRRGNHLFISEYGMQTGIHARYGIRRFGRIGKDFRFVNGNTSDYRYSNIDVINPYHGVNVNRRGNRTEYIAKIHINGDFIIGKYDSLVHAAIAYNKAADVLYENGCVISFEKNFIDELSSIEYMRLYEKLDISHKIKTYVF